MARRECLKCPHLWIMLTHSVDALFEQTFEFTHFRVVYRRAKQSVEVKIVLGQESYRIRLQKF